MLQFIRESLVRRLSSASGGLRLGLGRVHDVRGAAAAGVEVALDRGARGLGRHDLLVRARGGRDVFIGYVGCACCAGRREKVSLERDLAGMYRGNENGIE